MPTKWTRIRVLGIFSFPRIYWSSHRSVLILLWSGWAWLSSLLYPGHSARPGREPSGWGMSGGNPCRRASAAAGPAWRPAGWPLGSPASARTRRWGGWPGRRRTWWPPGPICRWRPSTQSGRGGAWSGSWGKSSEEKINLIFWTQLKSNYYCIPYSHPILFYSIGKTALTKLRH